MKIEGKHYKMHQGDLYEVIKHNKEWVRISRVSEAGMFYLMMMYFINKKT